VERPCFCGILRALDRAMSGVLEWDEWARISEGCYALRTNILDWKPEDLWTTYIQLTQVEAAFRIQKSDLAIRPVWHQKADRVKGHILVCLCRVLSAVMRNRTSGAPGGGPDHGFTWTPPLGSPDLGPGELTGAAVLRS